MKTKSIRFEQEYLNALERLEAIFDARKGTPEGAELEQLGALIDDYETKQNYFFTPILPASLSRAS
ncbi:hypothetical protein AGMMS4957_07420 [Bacteroidia bacterium]|nr:hypothetical protein AGMMS4957_07420 [Bacteroidia bacterium]